MSVIWTVSFYGIFRGSGPWPEDVQIVDFLSQLVQKTVKLGNFFNPSSPRLIFLPPQTRKDHQTRIFLQRPILKISFEKIDRPNITTAEYRGIFPTKSGKLPSTNR